VLTAARTEVDQIVCGANDLFLMLDYQQRVAFIAQVAHHPHELPDIARVQPDARFVHHKQRIHQ
jgi:hypothetical protein